MGQIHHNRTPKAWTTTTWAQSVREFWGGGKRYDMGASESFQQSEQYYLYNPYISIYAGNNPRQARHEGCCGEHWNCQLLEMTDLLVRRIQKSPPNQPSKKNFNRPCSLHFELGWSGAPRGLHGWLPNRPLSKTHKNTGDHPPGFSLHRYKLKILLESLDLVQSGTSSSAWWRTTLCIWIV